MRITYLFLFIILLPINAYIDIAKLGYEQYQDIIINNKIVQKANFNHHDCHTRYNIVQSVLKQFQRPFTMLDIGASQGYYSFRTAFDYQESVCVLIETDFFPLAGTQLFDLCKANTILKNIIYLNTSLTNDKIKRLGECENFDVILAMNVLHHIEPNNWRETADLIMKLGKWVIFETPPSEDHTKKSDIEKYIEAKGAIALGKAPRHCSQTGAMATIYLVKSTEDQQIKSNVYYTGLRDDTYAIISTTEEKYLIKHNSKILWVPGINLVTFKMLDGVYPEAETLCKALDDAVDYNHTDWSFCNMILQGPKIAMIDNNDPDKAEQPIYCSPKNIALTKKLIKIRNPAEARLFMEDVLSLELLKEVV